MHTIQTAAVVFCLACICAEIVTLFVGSGWARRCIKAAAGLYILVVFLQVIPGLGKDLRRIELPAQAPVTLPGAESQILLQTKRELEQKLEAACGERFGITVQLEIALEQTGQEISVAQVIMTVPPGSSASAQKQAADYHFQELGKEPILQTGEDVS